MPHTGEHGLVSDYGYYHYYHPEHLCCHSTENMDVARAEKNKQTDLLQIVVENFNNSVLSAFPQKKVKLSYSA